MDSSLSVDPAALERLHEWGGEELVTKMVQLFLENAPERGRQIRSGVESGDLKGVERGAHSLKSSAANLGAESVRSLARVMEEQAERGHAEGLDSLLERLEAALDHACDELRRMNSERET